MHKKYTFTLFISLITSFNYYAQRITISPFLGVKSSVSKGVDSWIYEKNVLHLYKSKNIPIYKPALSPLMIGFTIDYRHKKNIFSAGVIWDDGAEGAINIYDYLYYGSSGRINKGDQGGYGGVSVFKVPINYSRVLFEKYKSHVTQDLDVIKHKKFDIGLFSGINYIYCLPSYPQYKIPFSWGKRLLINNDTIEFVSYDYNYNNVHSLSFKLGTTFNLYKKSGKPFLTAYLYYEQGTKNLGAYLYKVYINDKLIGEEWSKSRGSAIQFKISFPITIYNKKPQEIQP